MSVPVDTSREAMEWLAQRLRSSATGSVTVHHTTYRRDCSDAEAAILALLAERDDWREGARAEARLTDMMKAERDAALAAVDAARREEREACAALVALWPVDACGDDYSICDVVDRDDDIAAAIRARSPEGGA